MIARPSNVCKLMHRYVIKDFDFGLWISCVKT